MLNLYLISQSVNNDYDTYDSAVVVARTEDDARRIHPSSSYIWSDEHNQWVWVHDQSLRTFSDGTWAEKISEVDVEYIGTSADDNHAGDVICSSFNAG